MDLVDSLILKLTGEENYNVIDYCEEVKKLGFLFFKDEMKNVFLKRINIQITQDILYKELYNLRETLIKKKENIWNSYVIYCVENNVIDTEFIISLERDNRYFRKYVISDESEFNRIHVINKNKVADKVFSNQLINQKSFNKEFSEKIFDLIDNFEGKDRRLNIEEIRNISKIILNIEGLNHEDK